MNPTYGSWVNVHEPKRPLEEEADEHADVFAAVCAIEEDRIKTQNRNLKGKFIMAQAETIQTQVEAVVHTRNQYGDPVAIIGKHLPLVSPDYYARVTNSMHWYSQMAVINAARAILFDLYGKDQANDDDTHTPAENLQTFCADIHDILKRPDIWETNDTCIAAAEKHRLMLYWEQKAISAANKNDRDYTPASLSELLLAEKPAKVRAETQMNWEVLAERQARKSSNDPAVIEMKKAEFMRRNIERENMQARNRVEDNKKLIGVTELIIEHIEANTPQRVTFTSMDKKFMRSAINFSIATLERVAEIDMAKDRKVTTQAYMRILDAQDSCIEELKKFMADHANEAEELEYAGTPQTDRFNREQASMVGRETPAAPANVEVPATPEVKNTKRSNKAVKVGDVVTS